MLAKGSVVAIEKEALRKLEEGVGPLSNEELTAVVGILWNRVETLKNRVAALESQMAEDDMRLWDRALTSLQRNLD